jgi:hypothetical protein
VNTHALFAQVPEDVNRSSWEIFVEGRRSYRKRLFPSFAQRRVGGLLQPRHVGDNVTGQGID